MFRVRFYLELPFWMRVPFELKRTFDRRVLHSLEKNKISFVLLNYEMLQNKRSVPFLVESLISFKPTCPFVL